MATPLPPHRIVMGTPGEERRFREAVGLRIKEARLSVWLTQQQVADAIDLSRPSLANIEKGRQGSVQLRTLRRLGRLFQMDYRDFLPGGLRSP